MPSTESATVCYLVIMTRFTGISYFLVADQLYKHPFGGQTQHRNCSLYHHHVLPKRSTPTKKSMAPFPLSAKRVWVLPRAIHFQRPTGERVRPPSPGWRLHWPQRRRSGQLRPPGPAAQNAETRRSMQREAGMVAINMVFSHFLSGLAEKGLNCLISH